MNLLRLYRMFKAAYCLILDHLALLWARVSGLPRDVWLLSERGFDARDNAYAFFRYLRTQHPEVRAVYVITPDSPDLPKVSALGKYVRFCSFRHRAYMMTARMLISTHDCGFTPDQTVYHHLRKHGLFRPRGKIAMLQHGVTYQPNHWYNRSECTPDLFVASSELEARVLTEHLCQPEKTVKVIGMPRYDMLDNEEEEDLILLMPTWRRYLVNLAPDAFRKSDYFRHFDGLMNDERLLRLLETHSYRLGFYPHVEMQKYYTPCQQGNISVATMQTQDVQSLLMRCRVLVTDYSSVFFDAAYMGKPIVFFQHDQTRYYAEHYPKGLLEYSDFGTVCLTEDEMLKALSAALTHEGGNVSRQEGFFKYHDRHNCDRLYEAILETLG